MPETLEIGYGGSERLTMNMGPQHPSAHGVFRAILTLEGETVVGVDAVIGYLHRCHEKLGETLTYVQYPSIASKTDYVAAMTAERAYVAAVELVGKIDGPKRAQWLRVLAAELQRVASHCLWLGTWCMDIGGALGGGATVFLYAIREREDILDLFESLTGARLLYGFHQPGGTRYDLPAGWTEQCRKTLDRVEQRLGEYEAMLEDNAFFLVRTQGVGVISRELAQEIGVSGPLLRGSGVNHDLRTAAPYSSYEAFEFRVPVETAGDCYARYRVRMVEFRESIKIARQALDGLPEGPISSRPGVKSVGQVRVPKGEGYARVEGARGEVGCYLVADGGGSLGRQYGADRLPRRVRADLRHAAVRAGPGRGRPQHRRVVLPRRLVARDRRPVHGWLGKQQQIRAALRHARGEPDHLLRPAVRVRRPRSGGARGLAADVGHRRGAARPVVRRVSGDRLAVLHRIPRRHARRREPRAVRHPRGRVRAGRRLSRRVQRHEVRAHPARRVCAHHRDVVPRGAAVPGRLARPRLGLRAHRRVLAPAEGAARLPGHHVGALELRADPRRPDPRNLVEAPAAGVPGAAARRGVLGRRPGRAWRLSARGSGRRSPNSRARSPAPWA